MANKGGFMKLVNKRIDNVLKVMRVAKNNSSPREEHLRLLLQHR